MVVTLLVLSILLVSPLEPASQSHTPYASALFDLDADTAALPPGCRQSVCDNGTTCVRINSTTNSCKKTGSGTCTTLPC